MQSYSPEIEQQMQGFYHSLSEKDRRRYAAIEALKLGWGGISYISQLLGCDDESMQLGRSELADEEALKLSKIRRQGGGRKSAFETIVGLDAAFLKVLVQHTAGSPMDETVKWTNLTRQEIAQLLKAEEITVSVTVVDQLLEKHNYRKRKAKAINGGNNSSRFCRQKRLVTGAHPQRHEQFENIKQIQAVYAASGNPVLSMDTKKEN